MSLTVGELAGLGNLGDHMRVGPQWAWPTAQGTPVIERGPHGQRFAPIPSESPGIGVRFWRESEGDFASQGWTPRAAVVGVMGLGATTELSDAGKNGITKIARMLDDEVGAAHLGDVPTLTSIDARARAALDTLGKYTPFESSYLPVVFGGWDSSQDVRATLQKVLADARDKAAGRAPPDRSAQSPLAEGAKEGALYAAPSGIPGVSAGGARDATVATVNAAGKAADALEKKRLELERKLEEKVDTAATVAKVLGVGAVVVIGAYALNAITGAKREFLGGRNPRRRGKRSTPRPAAFRYE